MLCKKFYLAVALAVLSVTVLGDHSIAKRSAGVPNWVCKCYQTNDPSQTCDGIIISERAILAVNSCITSAPNAYLVQCGNQVYAVAEKIVYNSSVPGDHNNDLCILILKSYIDFSTNPTCGPCKFAEPGYGLPTAPNACAVATTTGGVVISILRELFNVVITLITVLLTGSECAKNIPNFGTNNCCTSTGFSNGGGVMYDNNKGCIIGLRIPGSSSYSEFVTCYQPEKVQWCMANA